MAQRETENSPSATILKVARIARQSKIFSYLILHVLAKLSLPRQLYYDIIALNTCASLASCGETTESTMSAQSRCHACHLHATAIGKQPCTRHRKSVIGRLTLPVYTQQWQESITDISYIVHDVY